MESKLVTEGRAASNELSNSEVRDLPSVPRQDVAPSLHDAVREQYWQIFFKAQVNAVLRDHRKSQYRKNLPDWPMIAKRLRGVSVNTISTLRDNFNEGWKTWDGSAFSELPEALQNSTEKDKIQVEPASPKPAYVARQSSAFTNGPPKDKDPPKRNPKPRAKNLISHEEYHSDDGEYTAAKTVSTHLHSPPQPPFSGQVIRMGLATGLDVHTNTPLSPVSHHPPTICPTVHHAHQGQQKRSWRWPSLVGPESTVINRLMTGRVCHHPRVPSSTQTHHLSLPLPASRQDGSPLRDSQSQPQSHSPLSAQISTLDP